MAPHTDAVLSGIRSVTHLVYAGSYLRHLLSTEPPQVRLTVLDTGTTLGTGAEREATVRGFLPEHERLELSFAAEGKPWWEHVEDHCTLLSIGAPATRAYARIVAARRGHSPRVVVVDEGLGSYGTWRTRRAAYLRQGGSDPWASVRATAVATANRLLPDQRWSLYEQAGRGRRWVVNEAVAEEFRRRLTGSPPQPGVAVYLTQPWPELGIMTETAYAHHLVAVRDACAAAGLDLVVRPHPWEDPDRYAGFGPMTDRGPADLDRAVVLATVVLGGNSTALLNLSAIHGTRTVRVTGPELARLDAGLGVRQRALLDAFLPAPVPVDRLARLLVRQPPQPE